MTIVICMCYFSPFNMHPFLVNCPHRNVHGANKGGSPGSCRPQMIPMLAPWTWTLLSGWTITRGDGIPVMRQRTNEGLIFFLAAIFILTVSFFVWIKCEIIFYCGLHIYVDAQGTYSSLGHNMRWAKQELFVHCAVCFHGNTWKASLKYECRIQNRYHIWMLCFDLSCEIVISAVYLHVICLYL